MDSIQVIVTIFGLFMAALTAWYFWFSEKQQVHAAVTGNMQEILVKVQGGYSPDVIVVKAGKPVRLNFLRQESASCSDKVIFPDFQKSADLPEGKIVPIELSPEQPGEYKFNCPMGMFRGKLIVEK